MALAAYRNVLRATRVAFKGDFHLLHAARTQARGEFDKGRWLEAHSKAATAAIEHANGVAQVLTENIVQGQQSETAENTYKLRIHEQTERGYNDTVKNPLAPGGRVKVAGA